MSAATKTPINARIHDKDHLDRSDPNVLAAAAAERRLFEQHRLTMNEHLVDVPGYGLQVRVVETGRGTPVVLVNGGVGDAWPLTRLMAQLPGMRLLAVNRPGGGLSDPIDHRRVDLRRLAVDCLSAVLDRFGLDSAPLVGNSMGGLWASWFALARPQRVSRFVQLGCPALILDTSAPLPMRLLSVPILNRILVRAMVPASREKARDFPRFLGHGDQTCSGLSDAEVDCAYLFPRLPTYEGAWLSLMERVLTPFGARPDVRLGEHDLAQLRQPVLFLWGERDPMGGPEVARRAAEAVPHAQLEILEGTGHLPWFDYEERCGSMIADFFPTSR